MLSLEAQLTIKGYFFNTEAQSRAVRLGVKLGKITKKNVQFTQSDPVIDPGIFPFHQEEIAEKYTQFARRAIQA